MSSSVLGLGAASLGAASLGASSLKAARKARKYKQEKGVQMVRTPMPSQEDFQLGMALSKGKDRYMQKSVLGASGDFFYGEAPKKIPQGSYLVPSQPIAGMSRVRNPQSGYTTSRPVSTFQLITPVAPTQQQQRPQLNLDLNQGGKANKLNTKDINYAIEQGASRKEIKQAVKSQNIQMSAKAKSALFKNKNKNKNKKK